MVRFAFWKGVPELGGNAGLKVAREPTGADGVIQEDGDTD